MKDQLKLEARLLHIEKLLVSAVGVIMHLGINKPENGADQCRLIQATKRLEKTIDKFMDYQDKAEVGIKDLRCSDCKEGHYVSCSNCRDAVQAAK